jgi:chaperonin GroEL
MYLGYGDYVDMVKAGIIDPTNVVRLTLQGVASIAALLITTEAMVAETPEKAGPAMWGDSPPMIKGKARR